jgi:predicted RNA-binding protein YlxR (DUF448 family)
MEASNGTQKQEGGGYLSAEQVRALQTLLQGVQVAQKRGAYDLNEAELLSQAVKRFVVSKSEAEQAQQQSTEQSSSLNDNEDEPRVI